MDTLFASLLTILSVEYFLYLPFLREGEKLLDVTHKSVRTLSSKRISDHWKKRILIHYAHSIMKSTFYLIFMLSSLLVLMSVGAFLLDEWIKPKPYTIAMLVSPIGWVWMTIVASVYLYARNRFVK